MVESIERKPSICGNEIANVQQNINCVPITTKEYTLPLPNKLINPSQEQIIENIIKNIDLPQPTPMLANCLCDIDGETEVGTTTVFKWKD